MGVQVARPVLTRVTLAWKQQPALCPGAQRSRRPGRTGLLPPAHCRIPRRIGSWLSPCGQLLRTTGVDIRFPRRFLDLIEIELG